jgi:hypothetical protein
VRTVREPPPEPTHQHCLLEQAQALYPGVYYFTDEWNVIFRSVLNGSYIAYVFVYPEVEGTVRRVAIAEGPEDRSTKVALEQLLEHLRVRLTTSLFPG